MPRIIFEAAADHLDPPAVFGKHVKNVELRADVRLYDMQPTLEDRRECEQNLKVFALQLDRTFPVS